MKQFSINNARHPFSTVVCAPTSDARAAQSIFARNRVRVARLDGRCTYLVSDALGEKVTDIGRVQRIADDFHPASRCAERDVDVSFVRPWHNIGDLVRVTGTRDLTAIENTFRTVRMKSQLAEYSVGADGVPCCTFFVSYRGQSLEPPMKQLVKCIVPHDLNASCECF